ncbi:MAG: TIGR04283 family arsenosugar biosynthesis glycosyltransferase [Thermodesulfobacteriota bacterium]
MPAAFSIIMPVLEEHRIINDTIHRLQSAIADPASEIILVDGDPGGSTVNAVTSSQVRTLIGPKGRGPQMNAGAAAAAGRILLFVHADTTLPDAADRSIRDALDRRAVAGGAFELGIDNPRRIYRWIETMVRIRSRLTKIPYGDQAIFIRRAVFEKIGGFADLAIMEDIDLMQRVTHAGYRISLIPRRVQTSSRRWETEGPVFCTLRNMLLSTLYYAGVPADKLKRLYP